MGRLFVLVFFINLVIITGIYHVVQNRIEMHAESYNLVSWVKPDLRDEDRVHFEFDKGRDFAINAEIAFYHKDGSTILGDYEDDKVTTDEYIGYRRLNMFIRNKVVLQKNVTY
ncbi:hypothetical protein RJG79_08430 [Mycoplasmatota bacterium WC44]